MALPPPHSQRLLVVLAFDAWLLLQPVSQQSQAKIHLPKLTTCTLLTTSTDAARFASVRGQQPWLTARRTSAIVANPRCSDCAHHTSSRRTALGLAALHVHFGHCHDCLFPDPGYTQPVLASPASLDAHLQVPLPHTTQPELSQGLERRAGVLDEVMDPSPALPPLGPVL